MGYTKKFLPLTFTDLPRCFFNFFPSIIIILISIYLVTFLIIEIICFIENLILFILIIQLNSFSWNFQSITSFSFCNLCFCMETFHMFVQIWFIREILPTSLTSLFHFFMHRLNMLLKMSFLSYCIDTQFTIKLLDITMLESFMI